MAIKNVSPTIIRDLFDKLDLEWDLEIIERCLPQVHSVADSHYLPHCVLDKG